jgi:hypothetical protein
MEQIPSSEDNSCSSTEGIPLVLWNPKVHYRVHKSPTLGPVPHQMNPVNTLTTDFLKTHLNIILPSTPWSAKRSCHAAIILYATLVWVEMFWT